MPGHLVQCIEVHSGLKGLLLEIGGGDRPRVTNDLPAARSRLESDILNRLFSCTANEDLYSEARQEQMWVGEIYVRRPGTLASG